MATTEEQYARLNGETDSRSTQLIYPIDLVNDETYVPHVVVFEPNIISGHAVDYTDKLIKADNQITGVYGSEVAINTEVGGNGSLRRKKGIADFKDGKTNATYVKSDEKIVLPMPNVLNFNYSAQWQSSDIGALGRGIDFVNSMKDHNWGLMMDQAGEATKRSLAGAVQSLGIANVKDYMELTSGVSVNNYTEVLFKGMGNRMIPFSYTFTPRNLKEAEVIRAIIHRFKYHQAPEFKFDGGNNSYMLHPSTFDISFLDLRKGNGKQNSWLYRVSTCALTNISINGTPNGEYSVLTDGALTAITVDLIFTEMVTLSKEMMRNPEESF